MSLCLIERLKNNEFFVLLFFSAMRKLPHIRSADPRLTFVE